MSFHPALDTYFLKFLSYGNFMEHLFVCSDFLYRAEKLEISGEKVTYQQEVLIVNGQEQAASLIEMINAATGGEKPWLCYDSRRDLVNRKEWLKFGG